ncbi:hypothetical protein DFH29DRAFT_996422 [Suillus ampliporus]|nr:hypothetical protein DFH29DRAFT_996422 [Suillus ampliporus]
MSLLMLDRALSPTPPIAAVSWGQMSAIQVYYFTKDSTLQGLYWTAGPRGFNASEPLGNVLKGSLYAHASTSGVKQHLVEIRVGYQSPSNPDTITEAYYTTSHRWRTRAFDSTPQLD